MNQIENLSKTKNINCFLSKDERFSINDLLSAITFLKNGNRFLVYTFLKINSDKTQDGNELVIEYKDLLLFDKNFNQNSMSDNIVEVAFFKNLIKKIIFRNITCYFILRK